LLSLLFLKKTERQARERIKRNKIFYEGEKIYPCELEKEVLVFRRHLEFSPDEPAIHINFAERSGQSE